MLRRVLTVSIYVLVGLFGVSFAYDMYEDKQIASIMETKDSRLVEYNYAKDIAKKSVNILKLPYKNNFNDVKSELYDLWASDSRDNYFSNGVNLIDGEAPNLSVLSVLGEIKSDNSFTFRVEVLFGNEEGNKMLYLVEIKNGKILNLERV